MSEQEVHVGVGSLVDGRYKIKDRVGAGGFATVWRAQHVQMGRDVALKVLKVADIDSDAYKTRFQREAQVAARLNHPAVVTVYDFGIASTGEPYIAMELLDGWSLSREMSDNGAMSPQRAYTLLKPALEALGQAHAAGIIHRDLKPSNLHLIQPGTDKEMLQILDFGVARIDDPEMANLTATGALLGTPSYLAPEYIKEQIVTPAFDVYQIALIICELVSGVRAVDSNPYTAMMRHCEGTLEIAPELREGVVGRVMNKALHIDHTERYQNGAEFLAALDSISAEFCSLDIEGSTKALKKTAEVVTSHTLNPPIDTGPPLPSQPEFRASGPQTVVPPSAYSNPDIDAVPPAKVRRATMIAAIVCILAVGGIVAVLVTGGKGGSADEGGSADRDAKAGEEHSSAAEAESNGTPAESGAASAAADGKPKELETKTTPAGPAKVEKTPEPVLGSVVVNVEPPNAAVYKDDVELGVGSQTISAEVGSIVNLTATLEGYQIFTAQLEIQAEMTPINVVLELDPDATAELGEDGQPLAPGDDAGTASTEGADEGANNTDGAGKDGAEAESEKSEEELAAEKEARERRREERRKRREEKKKEKESAGDGGFMIAP